MLSKQQSERQIISQASIENKENITINKTSSMAGIPDAYYQQSLEQMDTGYRQESKMIKA